MSNIFLDSNCMEKRTIVFKKIEQNWIDFPTNWNWVAISAYLIYLKGGFLIGRPVINRGFKAKFGRPIFR